MSLTKVANILWEQKKNEEDLKIKWLNPLLKKSGWNVEKMQGPRIVWAEVTGSEGRVDYALKLNNRIVACIELKSPQKDIINEDAHRKQALKYASSYYYTSNGKLDPIIAICTNGLDAYIMDPGVTNSHLPINATYLNLKEQDGVNKLINLLKSIQENEDGSLPGIKTIRKMDPRPYASPATSIFEKSIKKLVKELILKDYSKIDAVHMTVQVLLLAAARDNGIIPNNIIRLHSEKKEWSKLAKHLNKLFGDVFEENLSSSKALDIWNAYKETSFFNVRLDILPAQYMGTIYEKIIRHYFKSDTSYFTPESLIDSVLENCRPTLDDSVLDPTCGSGAFLSKAIDYACREKFDNKKLLRFFNNVVGVDMDPIACKIAKVTLLCTFMRKVGENYQRNGEPLPYPQIKPPENFFDWNGGQFSLVIGNPPWAPIDDLDKKTKSMITSKNAEGEYNFKSYMPKSDQLCYVVEKSIEEHLTGTGRFGFVIKQQSLLSVYSKKFVEYLDGKVELARDFGAESKFHNYAQSTIICGRKDRATKWVYEYASPLETALVKKEAFSFDKIFVSTRGAQPGGEISIFKKYAKEFPMSKIVKKVPTRLNSGGAPTAFEKIAFFKGEAPTEFMKWLNKNRKYKKSLRERAIIKETATEDMPLGRDPYSWPRDSVSRICSEKILITDRNSVPGDHNFKFLITRRDGKWLSVDKHTVISSKDEEMLYMLGAIMSSKYFYSLCRGYKLIPRRKGGIFLNPVTLAKRLKLPVFTAADKAKFVKMVKNASSKNRQLNQLEISAIDAIFKRYLNIGLQENQKGSYLKYKMSEYLYPENDEAEADDSIATNI